MLLTRRNQVCSQRPMNISGEFDVDADPLLVWGVVMDPDTLCRLATTCTGARQIDETHWVGTIQTRVTLITVTAQIWGELIEAVEPERLLIAFKGETRGLPGSLHGTALLNLGSTGCATRGRYTIEMDVLGKLGSLGQPLFQMTAQRLARGFAAKVSDYLIGQSNT